ncbi:MAG: efflux RND transporter periplasmic adaptor subunit [Chloroherpetonaceae bacterium]|nr:efflux RND transporter periplasmic adaptor subunit [Chloroherpetonaceae bacterium]
MRTSKIAGLMLIIIATSCGKNSEQKLVRESNGRGKNESSAITVVYPIHQQKVNPIELKSIEKFIPSFEITIPCDLIAAPNQEAMVGSLVNGRVKSVMVNENDFVRAGQILAYIEGAEIGEVVAEYLQRAAEIKVAKIEKERSIALFKEKIISEKLYLESEKTFAIAEAKMKASKSRCLSIGFTEEDLEGFVTDKTNTVFHLPIRSKITGLVAKRNAVLGQALDSKETLFQIINLSTLVAKGYVYEPDFGKVKVGQAVKVKLGAYHQEDFSSSIDAIGTVVDESIHALPIRATIRNPNAKLKPAMHGEMIVYAKGEQPVLQLPKECLGIEGKESFCFLALNDSTFQYQRVKVIGQNAEFVSIESDIQVGAKAVSKGVFQLKAAMKSKDIREDE